MAENSRLIPPKDGATVRFYRTGHGDCFLLAFDGKKVGKPAYVLIDCGYKPGSGTVKYLKPEASIKDIARDIAAATAGHIDIAVITHEHQDHVNGITAGNFKNITIGQTWLAWTDDPEDERADDLRREFRDKLLGLVAARHRLAALNDGERVNRIDRFLAFELGGEEENVKPPTLAAILAALDQPFALSNKQSMKIFKDRAKDGVRYVRPHEEILSVPGAKNARAFALGPPRTTGQLRDLDPKGAEAFHLAGGLRSAASYFAAAADGADGAVAATAATGRGTSPFPARYAVPWDTAADDPEAGPFVTRHYGRTSEAAPGADGGAAGGAQDTAEGTAADEVPGNARFRRIDTEWLFAADQLALDMGDYTNNTSLVLAFELGKGGKVLLFAADAQRGNWVSWEDGTWTDGNHKVTTRDLLARTVLYKVGHHGSHNATLDGTKNDDWPNLHWMATGSEHAREFTAMITAVRAWADTQDGWDHPLKSIKDALLKKAGGRVFQTDTDFDDMEKPDRVSTADWKKFRARASGGRLYFDYDVLP